MASLAEDRLEEGTGGGQDHLVCSHELAIITSQGDISKVFIEHKVVEGVVGELLKVLPCKCYHRDRHTATEGKKSSTTLTF